ncbi:hypothetical protein [Streptomyces sp. WMMB 322]|uniref:hypothetical protein n=1 Tax=Streptomyces sp. WMMB 322 TaxID=1286821 RepID=UPI0008239F49|nr:hypothetical protein [Streptomyces sp. WMMB 322]SCK09620.1 hypothetical protein H180DRAFT_00482 [Streptomyces sp. WMMB 322]
MHRKALRLVALFTALFIVFAPSLLGELAAAVSPSVTPDKKQKKKKHILLVRKGHNPNGEELDDIARKIIRDPMGRELWYAIEKNLELPDPPPNTSVAFFDFGWMATDTVLPAWVRENSRMFLHELSDEIESPSSDPKWEYPLSVGMMDNENFLLWDLFEQLKVRGVDGFGNNTLLRIATGSRGKGKHSEDAMDEWMSRSVKNALRELPGAQAHNIEGVVRRIKGESGAGIAGPRTFCNACRGNVAKNGYSFKRNFAITRFDKTGSKQAKISNSIVGRLPKRLEREDVTWEKELADDPKKMLGLPCPPSNNSQSLNIASVPMAAPCGEGEDSSQESALTSKNYGGVDLSSLQLRYMSDDAGSGVKYAFSAQAAQRGVVQDSRTGHSALIGSMADLRTWLVLNPNKFWVNLNPDEPNRIIDTELGRTNAGRALLEADWRMKQTAGKLLNPKTSLGAEYWKKLSRSSGETCYSSRMWIIPGRVEVRQDGDSLYVLKAKLDVKAKAEDISAKGLSCDADPQQTARNERLEQKMVVPKIAKAVNTDPEYAPLRQAFLARVVAQWIRDRHNSGHTTSFDKLIDSGDLGPATMRGTWRPQQVYDAYLRSIRNGSFTYKRTAKVGNTTITYVTTTGGVDFGQLNTRKVSAEDMNRQLPQLPQTIQKSTEQPARASDGSIWLGDTVQTPSQGSTWDSIQGYLSGRTGMFTIVLVAMGVVLFLIRDTSGLRRKTSG